MREIFAAFRRMTGTYQRPIYPVMQIVNFRRPVDPDRDRTRPAVAAAPAGVAQRDRKRRHPHVIQRLDNAFCPVLSDFANKSQRYVQVFRRHPARAINATTESSEPGP
jgi:hypothetical protein